jgi:hypothetical protein
MGENATFAEEKFVLESRRQMHTFLPGYNS